MKRFTKAKAATMLGMLFLMLAPLAAWATITVTHSASGAGTGNYTTLNQAINACTTTSGTYTLTVDASHNISDDCTVKANVTMVIKSNTSGTQRTFTRKKKESVFILMQKAN